MASEADRFLAPRVRVAVARWREVHRTRVLLQERETELQVSVDALLPQELQQYMDATDRRRPRKAD